MPTGEESARSTINTEPASPDPRRCRHSRADGTRCNGWAIKDTGLCPGHSRVGLAASPEAAQTAAKRAGRNRKEQAQARSKARSRTLKDLLATQLEEHAVENVERMMTVVREGSTAEAMRAIEVWCNRVYGTPTQRVETEDTTKDPRKMGTSELIRYAMERLDLSAEPEKDARDAHKPS